MRFALLSDRGAARRRHASGETDRGPFATAPAFSATSRSRSTVSRPTILRGVELQLDEMQAVYGADRLDLWSFYGYLYTVQGNYGRAIDAYETAVALATRVRPVPTSGPFVQLANLYFARHQYDLALKTLLRPNRPAAIV